MRSISSAGMTVPTRPATLSSSASRSAVCGTDGGGRQSTVALRRRHRYFASGTLFREWQLDRECRPRAKAVTLGPDASAVQLHIMAHDGEPQSESSDAARRAAVALVESFEDVGQEARVDAPTCVPHADASGGHHAGSGPVDPATPRRELYPVGQHV